jgi:peroxiredoxin (alkyl hydroperoxide reductase subunit C)
MYPMIGKKVNNFITQAAYPDLSIQEFNLFQYKENKYAILFFYPLDFTFVCPTELQALRNNFEQFHSKDTCIIPISVDSQFCHRAYMEREFELGGIGNLPFPLVSDLSRMISRSYNILNEESTVSMRATFILDRKNHIRSISINENNVGRNTEEILRLVDAIQFVDENKSSCAANWRAGLPGIKS